MCVGVRASAHGVCARWRRVCEAESCVRRARHVIQRNPPPETRASEGDRIGYKASGNICPKTSARSSSGPRPLLLFPLDLSFGVTSPLHAGSRICNLHLKWMRPNNQHYTGINQHPALFWVSTFIFLLPSLYFFSQSLCTVFLCLPRCTLVTPFIINSRCSDVFTSDTFPTCL